MQLWRGTGGKRPCRGHRRRLIVLLWLGGVLPCGAQVPLAIWPSADPQEAPRIDGHRVVWHQLSAEFGDYDVVVADVNRLDDRLVQVLSLPGDQMYPDIWDRRVVWQEYLPQGDVADWDISGADFGEWDTPSYFAVSRVIDNDEMFPVISGNTVLWQDGPEAHSDIFASDITDPNRPLEFVVAAFEGSQGLPAVDRTLAVWQGDSLGDWDIYASDIWLRDRPQSILVTDFVDHQVAPAISGNAVVWQDDHAGDWDLYVSILSEAGSAEHFPIASLEGHQVNARIDGPLIVWQDDRFGQWDIYLYNLNTGKEFRLTNHRADQVFPDIAGDLVVWQDNREGTSAIFIMRLSDAMLKE